MKVKVVSQFILSTCIMLSVTGCDITGNTQQVSTEQESSTDYIEMTADEKQLLSAIYADTERIQEGKLFDHQVEALRQLRAGEEYLSEKYPGYTLDIISFEPATKFNKQAVVYFSDNMVEDYLLHVKPSNNSYVCTDTFYGNLIQEKYDARLCDILSNAGYSVKSYTTFPTPKGIDINKGTSVDELISMKSDLTRNTDLFIEGTSGALDNEVKDILSNEGIYGAYTMYYINGLQNYDIMSLETNKGNYEKVTFNCFDVR